MAKKKVESDAVVDESIIDDSIENEIVDEKIIVEEVVTAPEVIIPLAPVKQVVKKEKVKLIKELPRLYIAGSYYSGKKGEDLIVPAYVAYILRGSDNRTETFAV